MGNFNSYGMPNVPNNWNNQFSNVSFVASLDEALARCNSFNSDMVYFHQDQPVFYRVKVDMYGKKTWAQFAYSVPNPDDSIPVTKSDLQSILQRLENLEKGKVNNSDEPNG